MSTIRILSGSYRNQTVRNEVFTLVKGFQTGKKGNYVTVKNEGQFDIAIDTVKVKVESMSDVEFVGGEPNVVSNVAPVVSAPVETDEEAIARIRTRFAILMRWRRLLRKVVFVL